MTIINQKSISGITSITTAAAGDNLLTVHTNNGTERLRIDSSGNTRVTVGIVTTLTITGNGTVGGTLGVTGDVDIADKIVHTGDTDTAIRFPAADTFTVETAGSERVRVTAAGSVGIGTDNPGDKLSIYTAPNALVFGAKDTTRGNHIFQLLADDAGGNGELRLYRNSATGTHEKTVQIQSSGDSYFTGGSIGIGEDSPETLLHLKASTTPILTIQNTTNTSYTGIQFDRAADDTQFAIYSYDSSHASQANNVQFYNYQSGALSFHTSNTERLRIQSGGGISFNGDTAAANALDDYEEGSWSPIFSTNTAGASGQSYQQQRGKYTKIGSILHCSFDVVLSSLGTFSGTYVTLGGLPYTNIEVDNKGGSMTIGYYSGFTLPTGGTTITSYSNGANVYIMTPHDSDGDDYLRVADVSSQMNNTSRLIGSMTLYLTS